MLTRHSARLVPRYRRPHPSRRVRRRWAVRFGTRLIRDGSRVTAERAGLFISHWGK